MVEIIYSHYVTCKTWKNAHCSVRYLWRKASKAYCWNLTTAASN